MPRYQNPSPSQRRPVSSTSIQISDAMLFGITRGVSGMPRRDPGSSSRNLYRPGDSFEEAYPRFEFSALVTLALRALHWLMRKRKSTAAANVVNLDAARSLFASSRRARPRQLAQ